MPASCVMIKEKLGRGDAMPFRDLPGVTQCRFKRGEVLIAAGEPAEYVYYLQSGVVYRELLTDAGHESIMSLKTSNSVAASLVGILTLYRRRNPGISNYDFIAHTNCVCYRIPKDVCMEYLRNHSELLEEVLYIALDEYTRLMDLTLMKWESSVSVQLCKFLLEYSRDSEAGRVLSKKYSNIEISKFLSMHKVTVARVLRALKEQGCVERTNQGLLLKNVPLLTAFAQGDKVLEYK